ncbi:MAG TPA: hypothetical protein VJV78_12285, partial [Polyangiales bacterium]|nr:hypothetical protein [Polyangiales bacterium]
CSGEMDAGAGGGAAGAAGSGSRGAGQSVQSISAGNTSSSQCAVGSVRCDGNWVVRCEEGGQTTAEETCAFACHEGACSGSCIPKTLRCSGQERQRCDDAGEWQTLETCSNVCTPAACAQTCTEGARQCSGTIVMRCSGGKLVEDTDCGFVCKDGACSGTCQPGARRCMDGAASSCGVDGMWQAPAECATECVDGSCTGACMPGAQRCAGSSAYQRCNELGQWGSNQGCPGACFLGNCSGDCVPGAVRCQGGSNYQTCEVDGRWGTATSCNTGACVDGRCMGMCTPGAKRCDPGGAARVQTCSNQGTWQAGVTCAGGSCSGGVCAQDCTPNTRRCDPIAPQNFQTCTAQGNWGTSQTCPQAASCSGAGQCIIVMSGCDAGQSPDWLSPPQSGGNSSLDDPRWGSAPAETFTGTFGFNTGGYILLVDRATKQLALSIRMTMGPNEAPTPADYVYFAATPNVSGSPSARSAAIPLIDLLAGEGPKQMTSFETKVFGTSWQSENVAWVQDASAWHGGPNDGVSWAVQLHVDLSLLGIDLAKPFRIALAAHADGATGDLTTPKDAGMLTNMPEAWAQARIESSGCVSRVKLE